jgi:hypothetical protein
MIKTLLASAALTFALAAPSMATTPAFESVQVIKQGTESIDQLAKRGRGKKGRRTRVPGGSGCDSAHDMAEHPECRRT